MIRQYVKLHIRDTSFILTIVLALVCSAVLLPNIMVTKAMKEAWTREIAHANFFDQYYMLSFWLPLYSLFMVFHLWFFLPNVVYSRYERFWKLWKVRCCVLFLDAVFFAVLLHVSYLLYSSTVASFSYSLDDLLFELRCFIPQLASLFLYGCFCAVFACVCKRVFAGIAVAFLISFVDFFIINLVAQRTLLFFRGFVPYGNWLSVGATLFTYLILAAGIMVVLWCFAAHSDQIIEGKD